MNNNVLHMFPDNNQPKEVYLQANGKDRSGAVARHVSLFWINRDDARLFITQIIHLIGIPGRYHWENVAKMRDPRTVQTQQRHDIYWLGTFSRAQRDRIIQVAGSIYFEPSSTVNDCRVWMRDLLDAMTKDPSLALPQSTFMELDRSIPLCRRRPEASSWR
ncbi:hypothetical protein K488DRAFT_78515 [Vararia minispora EC-137]|uniref:Uncharacterized protein n=1 Tax=Vararia minispora EC-137 TaxID=1314806 RepID=A0ACB8QLA4_9AGAM|nr:hypothetical protein K488DRAFT_78515 [Vararia minispora EC-137]